MRATRAAVNGGNGLIYLFMAFGALCFFGYAVIILLGVALVVTVVLLVVKAITGRRARRERAATQARIAEHAQRLAAQRSQAHYSNRR